MDVLDDALPLVRAKLRPPRPLRTLVQRAGLAERLEAAVADAVRPRSGSTAS